MRYEGTVYRPPSEANSLILQATVGCSYNRCTFCAMYREAAFRIRPFEELEEDIRTARDYYGEGVRRVFLADGDALIKDVETAIKKGEDLMWVTDARSDRHGLAVGKIAFVQVEGEKAAGGVGF